MARFIFDPDRINSTLVQRGKEYNLRLIQRGQTILSTLLDGLGSSYVSAIQGPNYTQALKAVALELSRLELALEDVDRDRSVPRSDFLWSLVGYLALVNNKIPDLGYNDEQFREFFLNLIQIYFQGSIPKSMQDIVALFFSDGVKVTEEFLLVRQGNATEDLSNQFTFGIDYLTPIGEGFPPRLFEAETAIRQLLDLVRPAHTLFKLRFVFPEPVITGDVTGEIVDEMRSRLLTSNYDDFRSFWSGMKGVDRLGMKQIQAVVGEDHSHEF